MFTKADKRLLVRYCKSDSMLDALNAKRAELTRAELAKLARLISMQRQIRLALRFKELARKEARSAAPEGHAAAHSISGADAATTSCATTQIVRLLAPCPCFKS